MSKLADRIRRATRAESAPIGFTPGTRKPAPTMLMVALAGDRWAQAAGEAVAAGADVLLLSGRPADKELADAVAAAEGRPCGALAADADGERLKRLGDAGLDFVVLPPQAPASALQDEKLGFVLQLRGELTDIQLRTLEALPLDALYVEVETGPVTILRQTELRRLAGLARTALLLPVRTDTQREELLALRDAGVVLVAVDLKERGAVDSVRRLRAVIDELPRRRRPRRDEGAEVVLPRAGEPAEEAEDEDA